MKLFLRLSVLILLSGAGLVSGNAQDLHFSLVDYMPVWSNAANTGGYYGTARVGGIYRNQWASIIDKGYQTPGFYVDAPILSLGKKKDAWLGVGGQLISDKAGLAGLSMTSAQASIAYHKITKQNRKSRTVFSFGLKGGILNRSADLTSRELILSDEQDEGLGGGGLGVSGSPDRGADLSSSGVDIGAGISLSRKLDDDRNFRIGISADHLSMPEQDLLGTENKKTITFGAQAAYRQLINDAYLIEPQVYFQTTAGSIETQVQGMIGLLMGNDGKNILRLGAGVRLPARFVYPMVSYQTGDLKVGASFDISANKIQQAEKFQSGFELGVEYIIKVFKQPKIENVILCPQI